MKLEVKMMPITVVIFIVLLVLKLVDVITWSWWWVTAPLWLPVCALIALSTTAYCIAMTIDKLNR